MRRFDILVIGGGVAGLTAATRAAQFGLSVALVERGRLGGTALWTGALPLQALLKCADLAHSVRAASRFGIQSKNGGINVAAVLDRVRTVVRAIQPHRSPEYIRSLGIEIIHGEASFLDRTTVEVGGEAIQARRIILATGARPAETPIDGLAETGYLTYEGLWEITDLPRRLAVLGGTPIGVQMAQAMARLGSQVTLLEAGDRILEAEDAELADRLAESLRAEGLDVRTKAEVVQVLRRGNSKVVSIRQESGPTEIETDELVLAVDRVPNIQGLNLGATEIETTRTGVVVDRHLRTTQRRVWAVGDCNGQLSSARAAAEQARVAVSDALFPWGARYDPKSSWAIFMDPALAHVGMTEEQARRAFGDGIRVHRHPFSEVDGAVCRAETAGLVKLVADPRGRLVGGHILGAGAGEILPALAQAVASRNRPDMTNGQFYAYPSTSESLLAALRQVREDGVNGGFSGRVLKRIVRWYV